MTTFVDTSALYALLDEDDENHSAAAAWLSGPGGDPAEELLTHNYVVVEAAALVHRRLGATAIRALLEDLIPALAVAFVDESLHRLATSAFLGSARRRLSLVDWVSFELMRDLAVDRAFAFDRDFADQGFHLVP